MNDLIDKVKTYIVTVGLEKLTPMFVMGIGTAAAGLWAAHHGLLEQYGVTYGTWPLAWPAGQDPSGPVILIELDTLTKGVIALLGGLFVTMMRATEHHVIGPIVSPPPANIPAQPR